ncbi:hypothetical protein [Amphritea sp. HPY]|uniref:hypothetical protein n=1 Tax=Amphritea sp. HPY TaxID=3421652 RepID=UPI003D7D61DB
MPLQDEQLNVSAPTTGSLSEAIAKPTYTGAALTGDDIRVPDLAAKDFDLSFDFAKKAASEQWLNPITIAERAATNYEEDPQFDPQSAEMLKAIPSLFNDEQQQLLMEAKSEDHWLDLKEEFDAGLQYQEELALGGPEAQFWSGAIGMLDPTALAAVGLSEGAALAWLARGNKLKNLGVGASAAITGGAGATSEAVLAGLRAGQFSEYDEEDALIDMSIGAAFGGTLGAGYTAYHKFGKAMLADKMARRSSRDASAAETDSDTYFVDRTQNAHMKRSASTKMRDIADEMSSSGANPNGVAADSTSDQFRTRKLADHNKIHDEAFQEFKKESGVKSWQWIKERMLRKEFSQQAGRYNLEVQSGSVDPSKYHPAVMKYADSSSILHHGIGQEAGDVGVSGFKDFESKPGFFKRKWKGDSHLTVTNRNGDTITESGFENLVFQSMKKRVEPEKWTPAREKLVAKVAFGFTRNFMKGSKTEMKSLDEILLDEEGLAEFLRLETELEIGDIQKLVTDAFVDASDDITKRQDLKGKKANEKKQNAYDRGKKRMDLDMALDIDGFNLGMFIDTDLEKMSQEYILEMGGHIAMARHLGVKNPRQLAELRNKIESDVPQADRKKELELFEQVRNEIYGKPMVDQGDSTLHRTGQQLRRVTFTTSMGLASMAALTEVATIVAENGVRASLKNLPALGQITKAAFLRKQGPQLIKEANSFDGAIADEYLATMYQDLDDLALQDGNVDGVLNKVDIVTHKLQRGMGYLSFLEPVDRSLKMYAFSTGNTAVYDNLIKGSKTRFPYEDYGIGKTLKKRIKEQFKAHPPELDKWGAVKKNHFEKWDADIRRQYIAAMHRANTMQVQKQLAGEKIAMFEGPIGKIWTQFRSFMIGSWAKHSLRTYGRLKSGEGREAAVIAQMVAAPLAAMQYTMRTYAQAAGREDQDEFLEKRLRPEVIAATAANYMPALGVPMAFASTGLYIGGGAMPVFRSSGYAPDLATAGPVPEFLQSLTKTARNVTKSATGEMDWSDGNWRNAARLIPFNNTLVGTAFTNTMLHYND